MRAIVIFSLIVVASSSQLSAVGKNVVVPQKLSHGLIMQESSGYDNAIGDKGKKDKAYGCLQIRQPCLDDVNRWLGTRYQAQDMLGNRKLSLLVCRTYLERYATAERLGRTPTMQDMARIWNGGPCGAFDNGAIDSKGTLLKDPRARARLARVQRETAVYWSRVQRFLK